LPADLRSGGVGEYSRWREIAIWMIAAEIGARIQSSSGPMIPSGESLSPPIQSTM